MDIKKMVKEIQLMMGHPKVRLEIDENQIEELIHRAYRKIKPYITDRRLITFTASQCVDLSEYKVVDVVRVYPTQVMSASAEGQELLFDFQAYRPVGNNLINNVTRVAKSAAEDFDIPFRFVDNKIYISQSVLSGSMTAECLVDIVLEDLKDERAISWIQAYSEALVKEVVGRIRGKFRSSNLPIEIDSETLLSEAQSEKERLESELYDHEYGQFFILR